MDISLIIYLVIFFVVVYLIFKFIKKVIFAILSVVVLVMLIIGGVGALIYSDINNLTSHENYDVKFLYSSNDEDYLFGVSLPFDNQSLELEQVKSLSDSQINDLDVDAVDDEGSEFVIVIDDERFEELVVEESYNLGSLGDFSLEGYDFTLSGEELLDVVNSEDGEDLIADILIEKNDLTDLEATLAKPFLIETLSSNLDNLEIREMLFLLVVSESMADDEGIVNIVEGYKADEVRVYPNRISFRFLKLLPVSTIKSFLYEDEGVAQE